ncbi:hypothetical protein P4E94_19230 [Pontiellaceae bacterium B12219]|nr:hypothetical protein [Pontiellaceae bacterium B12219]
MATLQCPHCDKTIIHYGSIDKCPHCQMSLSPDLFPDSSESLHNEKYKPSDTKYPALITISTIYRVIAFLIGVTCSIGVLIALINGQLIVSISLVIGGLIGVVTNLAIAEGILVFLNIEKNTRETLNQVENISNQRVDLTVKTPVD